MDYGMFPRMPKKLVRGMHLYAIPPISFYGGTYNVQPKAETYTDVTAESASVGSGMPALWGELMGNAIARMGRLVRLATRSGDRAQRRRRKACQELLGAVESGSLVVAVQQFGGLFEMDCRSHVLQRILVDGFYESAVVDIVRRRIDPARDAIDVGANAGLFTVLMSGLVGPESRVLAIEPTPGALRFLKRNLERNGRRNVEVFEGIAADRAGAFTLHVIPGMEEYSSQGAMRHPSIAGRPYHDIPVAGETVDALVERLGLRPGLIKIDAEGAESSVLAGCRRTLGTFRPMIICESWPEKLRAAGSGSLGRLFDSYRYAVEPCGPGEILACPK